ncbi:hypothetical protein ACSU6B_21270 [Neobacillus sp. C211]|uniref:hypothetical protein n=1 Tax=unclassified Neobacillus TaxID=2675272 RepID=UPI00397BBB06
MVEYFFMLILSVIFIILTAVYLWFIYKKKKNGKIDQIPLKETLSALFILLLSICIFAMFVRDLPDVLFHHTKKYEGKCEIDIYSGRGARLEANFGKHSIRFGTNDYYKAQEGDYCCKVEYYPHSEEGYSLKLYQSKSGKLVETK